MKKFSWNKFLNISLIVATVLVLGCILVTAYFYKPPKTTYAEPLVEGVPFKVGIMDRLVPISKNNLVFITKAPLFLELKQMPLKL